MENTKRICAHCNQTLRAVGTSRKNGKGHKDWDSREYHKKCFVIVKQKKIDDDWLKDFREQLQI